MPGFRESSQRWPYVFFFAAIALTGVGSAYYHWHPDNDRLLWDRLPLAIAFMALFAIIIAERIDRRVGMWLFVPLVILGGGSVVYWHVTGNLGTGDSAALSAGATVPVGSRPHYAAPLPGAVHSLRGPLWRVGLVRSSEAAGTAGQASLFAGPDRQRAHPQAPIGGAERCLILHMLQRCLPLQD